MFSAHNGGLHCGKITAQVAVAVLCIFLFQSVGVSQGFRGGNAAFADGTARYGAATVPYDRLQAGWEAYQYAEAQRRASINAQLQLVERVDYYRQARAAAVAERLAVLPRVWAHGVYEHRWSRAYRLPVPQAHVAVGRHWYLTPYECGPWLSCPPLGVPYLGRVVQPLGHTVVIVGPNTSIYRPIMPQPTTPEQSSPQEPQQKPEVIPTPQAE